MTRWRRPSGPASPIRRSSIRRLDRDRVMAEEHVRRDLLVKTVLEILRDAGAKVPPSQVLDELRRRIELTPYELSADNSGMQRYNRAAGFHTLEAATIGWMSKIGGWSITDAGTEALETYPDAWGLWAELQRPYRGVDQRRRQALQNLSEVHQFIATTLLLVDPGSWTAHDDLAELADTTASQVADFLANASVRLPNSYRVLNADGAIPAEGMLNFNYRGADLHHRLASEGVEFDASGRASQNQRLTADALRELLEAREAEDEGPAPAKRAWMVRGSNVDGYNLEGYQKLSNMGFADPRLIVTKSSNFGPARLKGNGSSHRVERRCNQNLNRWRSRCVTIVPSG